MKQFLVFMLLLFSLSRIYGQTIIQKSIELRDSSISKDIAFDVGKGVFLIRCSVISFLSSGELSCKLVDPEGKIEGRFWLGAVNDDGKIEPSSGRMTHEVKLPHPGTWKLKIQSRKSTGNLSYKLTLNQP